MALREYDWKIGDVFTVETLDGRHALGQIIGRERDLMRCATVALFDERFSSLEEARSLAALEPARLYSVLFVSVNHLESGQWPIVRNQPAAVDSRLNPWEHTRAQGFIGAKVIGSGIVTKFVNAFYGLRPWDAWKDPNYLDSLLISEQAKPLDRLIFKG